MRQTFDLPRDSVLTASIWDLRDRETGTVATDSHRGPGLTDEVGLAIAAIPGVDAWGMGSTLPRQGGSPRTIVVGSEASGAPPEQGLAMSAWVAPGYFETLQTRVVLGRLFRETDLLPGGPPIAIVNEPFVRTFLGGRPPLGQRIQIVESGSDSAQPTWREIVGVVPDLGLSDADAERAAGVYVPREGDADRCPTL